MTQTMLLAKKRTISTILLVVIVALFGGLVQANQDTSFYAVPHSHNDLSRAKSFESYYEGNSVGCVSCMYSDIFNALYHNQNYTFIIAEVAYFKKWWESASSEEQQQFKTLLELEQIEFVNGGYSVNDEACTYHDLIIDQFTLGHQFLLETFNIIPKNAWSVGLNGHSAGQAWLLSKMGYDTLFFDRVHQNERKKRVNEGEMEFLWHPFNDASQSIFTHILQNDYFDIPQHGDQLFCRYLSCEGKALENSTLDAFKNYVSATSKSYLTNNVAQAIGDDFAYSFSGKRDIEKISVVVDQLKPLLSESKFSVLKKYINKVHESYKSNSYKGQNQKEISSYANDFFPVATTDSQSNNVLVYTGFYSSKPVLKGLVNEAMRYLTALRTLCVKLSLNKARVSTAEFSNSWNSFRELEEALALAANHNGVTGGSKASVDESEYYGKIIKARKAVEKKFLDTFSQALQAQGIEDQATILETSGFSNQDVDESYTQQHSRLYSKSNNSFVTVFNPGKQQLLVVKLKISDKNVAVFNEDNEAVKSAVFCLNVTNSSDCTLYFTEEFGSFQLRYFKIVATHVGSEVIPFEHINTLKTNFGNSLSLEFTDKSMSSFKFISCDEAEKCTTDEITLDYKYYTSDLSGAYVFHPNDQKPQAYGKVEKTRVFEGDFMTIFQIIRKEVVTNLIVYHQDATGLEIETQLEPISNLEIGKEVILHIKSQKISNLQDKSSVFYTDSNGLKMIKRIYGSNNANKNIQENYYPITSAIYIEDSSTKQRLTLLNDRSQGGSSSSAGEIQVMIHRVCTHDDSEGMHEVLKDINSVTKHSRKVTTSHFLILGKGSQAQRQQQYKIDHPPLVFVGSSPHFSAFKNNDNDLDYPQEEHLKVSVRPFTDGRALLRVHNLDEENTHNVSLKGDGNILEIIAGKKLQNFRATEFTLTGNQELATAEKNKLTWKESPSTASQTPALKLESVEIKPMDVRAFMIEFL